MAWHRVSFVMDYNNDYDDARETILVSAHLRRYSTIQRGTHIHESFVVPDVQPDLQPSAPAGMGKGGLAPFLEML